jgi:hypothetical protein
LLGAFLVCHRTWTFHWTHKGNIGWKEDYSNLTLYLLGGLSAYVGAGLCVLWYMMKKSHDREVEAMRQQRAALQQQRQKEFD